MRGTQCQACTPVCVSAPSAADQCPEGLDCHHYVRPLHDPQGFETPQDLWSALGLLELTQVSMRDYLQQRGVASPSSKLVRELVGSVNKVNYNQVGEEQAGLPAPHSCPHPSSHTRALGLSGVQDNGLNALAGVVSLCPMVTGSVFSLSEGNEVLAQAMLNSSSADVMAGVTVG